MDCLRSLESGTNELRTEKGKSSSQKTSEAIGKQNLGRGDCDEAQALILYPSTV